MADAQTPDSTPRWHQLFPVLTDAEIDRINRFGAIHGYAAGEFLYRAGGISPGMFVHRLLAMKRAETPARSMPV